MDKRVFLILIAAALALIALWYPTTKISEVADRELLLPGLKERLNDIDRITITAGGERAVATLKRGPTLWTVAERSDYPADVGKIRKNLIALADARILEEKTSDPAFYDRLAVEDIDQEQANGIQIVIEQSGQGPEESIAIIIGNTGGVGNTAFVRRTGGAQSLLVKAEFDLSKDTGDWMNRDLMDISSADIHSVTIDHPDKTTLRLEKPARGDSDFTLLNVPEGRELEYASIGNSIGEVLSALKLDDVILASDVDTVAINPVVARFETFDGLVVETSTFQFGEQKRIAIRARADESLADRFRADDDPDVGEDDKASETDKPSLKVAATLADEMNTKLGPWMYTLPSFKVDQLVKRPDDLLKPVNE